MPTNPNRSDLETAFEAALGPYFDQDCITTTFETDRDEFVIEPAAFDEELPLKVASLGDEITSDDFTGVAALDVIDEGAGYCMFDSESEDAAALVDEVLAVASIADGELAGIQPKTVPCRGTGQLSRDISMTSMKRLKDLFAEYRKRKVTTITTPHGSDEPEDDDPDIRTDGGRPSTEVDYLLKFKWLAWASAYEAYCSVRYPGRRWEMKCPYCDETVRSRSWNAVVLKTDIHVSNVDDEQHDGGDATIAADTPSEEGTNPELVDEGGWVDVSEYQGGADE